MIIKSGAILSTTARNSSILLLMLRALVKMKDDPLPVVVVGAKASGLYYKLDTRCVNFAVDCYNAREATEVP